MRDRMFNDYLGDNSCDPLWVIHSRRLRLSKRFAKFMMNYNMICIFYKRNLGLAFGGSHYAQPNAPIIIFYLLLSTHFFGLSTEFGLSIPQPLHLDGDYGVPLDLKWRLLPTTRCCEMRRQKLRNENTTSWEYENQMVWKIYEIGLEGS